MEQMGTEKTTIYRAALYCRLSKDDGTDVDSMNPQGESISIGTQKIMLEKYCHEQGFSIYDRYVDDGYSGLNFNRPEFTRMLTDIDEGKINLVITKDLSRFGRDYIQTGYYTDIYFSQKRVRYIAVNDGIDTIRDDNDIAPFKNILNDMYAKDLSRKVKSAKRQRAMQGYYISAQPPYGYQVDIRNKNRLLVDEEPANVVKEMFRFALAGNSFRQISRWLTEQQIITPSAYKAKNGDTRFSRYNKDNDKAFDWCYQTVKQILENQVYVGDMVNHKFEVMNYKTKERCIVPSEQQIIVKNTHEAVISRDDFERVQQFMQFRKRPRKHNFDNVFKDLIFCSECGTHMTLMMKHLKTGLHGCLRCTNRFSNPEQCTHYHYIYYDDLYEEIQKRIQLIAKRVQSGELLKRIQKQTKQKVKTDKLQAEKKKIDRRLQVLKKIVKKLYEDFACDLLDNEAYHEMLGEYTKEQKQLTKRLAEIQTETEKKDSPVQNVQKLKEELDKYLEVDVLTANQMNQLIERIEIGYPVKVDGCKQQEINIVYRFVGTVDKI